MSASVQIFVRLLNEAVDVWRPVRAEQLDQDVYAILNQPYDREIEAWQFEPGDKVVCEMIDLSDSRILAATKRAPGDPFVSRPQNASDSAP
ncbi:MAG: hypothetical protein HY723_01120 [Chloroflexi bacterium]|nr:hypothetical protein [Chloroflexota bacterium]